MAGSQKLSAFSFKYYDFLGSEFKLKYNTSGKYKTLIGGILSFFTTGIIIAAFWVILKTLMATDSPEVSITTNLDINYPKMDLYKEGFFNGFGIVANRRILPVSEIFKYITVLCQIMKVVPDGVGGLLPELGPPIPYIPCKDITNPDMLKYINLEKGVSELMSAFGICPNLTRETLYFVQSKGAAPPRYTLEILILPCSLPNPADCVDMGIGRDVYFHYTVTNKILNLTNFEEPVKVSYHLEHYISFLPTQTKSFIINLKNNEIYDDTLDLVAPKLKMRYTDVDEMIQNSLARDETQKYCTPFQIATFQCHEYMRFSFFSTGKKIKIVRTYPKLFSALARMGGISGIFTLIATSIYSYYNRKQIKKYLKGKLFSKEKEEDIVRMLFPNVWKNNSKTGSNTILFNSKGKNSLKFKPPSTIPSNDSSRLETQSSEQIQSLKVVEKIISKNLKANEDGATLFQKINQVTLLENMFYEPHDKILLPLVLLNIEKKKVLQEERVEHLKRKILGNLSKSTSHTQTFGKKGTRKSVLGKLAEHEEEESKHMSVDEAYESLLNYEPPNEVKKHIKQFVLSNLPPMKKTTTENSGISSFQSSTFQNQSSMSMEGDIEHSSVLVIDEEEGGLHKQVLRKTSKKNKPKKDQKKNRKKSSFEDSQIDGHTKLEISTLSPKGKLKVRKSIMSPMRKPRKSKMVLSSKRLINYNQVE